MKATTHSSEVVYHPRYWLAKIPPEGVVIIEEYIPNRGIVLYSESQTTSNGSFICMDQIHEPIEIDKSHLPRSLHYFDIEELRKNEPQYFY